MKSGSLRLRLVAGGAAAIVLALLVAGAGLAYLFERHVLRALADDLEVELRQALATIEIDPAGRPLLRREPSNPRFADPLSGLYWQATTEAGVVSQFIDVDDVLRDLCYPSIFQQQLRLKKMVPLFSFSFFFNQQNICSSSV